MNRCAIDLHMHSCYSDDGEFSPKELVQKCKDAGINIMAISDHNCVKANEEAEKYASIAGIAYIPAVEIDCTFKDVNLHVLGYGIDYKSHDFADIEENVSKQSAEAAQKMLLATQGLGFEINENDMMTLAKDMHRPDHWTGEMFAEVLLSKPEYKNHALLMPYRNGGDRCDNPYVNFYWDFYAQGKACYVKISYPSLEEVIAIIHRNGGKAVLAHPAVNLKGDRKLLKAIGLTGIDGIEAFSSYHLLSQAADFYDEAMRSNKLVTCGSDFHGKTKPAISIGQHGCYLSNDEMIMLLKDLINI